MGRVDVMSRRGTRKRILTNENDAQGTKKACTSLPVRSHQLHISAKWTRTLAIHPEKTKPEEMLKIKKFYFWITAKELNEIIKYE